MKQDHRQLKWSSQGIIAGVFFLCIFFFSLTNIPVFINGVKENVAQKTRLEALPSALLKSYNEHFLQRSDFVNIIGLGARIAGQRVLNDVVRLKDDHLYRLETNRDVSNEAKSVSELQRYLGTIDVPLVYMQVPIRMEDKASQLPEGLSDYSNEMVQKIVQALQDDGIDVLDMQQKALSEGIRVNSLFFHTDHHWTIEGSLWATRIFIDHIQSKYRWDIDDADIQDANLTKQVFKQSFLGSYGRRVGKYFGGMDDITIIKPKRKMMMQAIIPNASRTEDINREGSFDETILYMDNVTSHSYFTTNPYAVYTGADRDEMIIWNRDAANAQKLLVIKDSYGLPVVSFLSLCFREVRALDLRYYMGMPLVQYIEQMQPDAVLFVYNQGAVTGASDNRMFEFGTEESKNKGDNYLLEPQAFVIERGMTSWVSNVSQRLTSAAKGKPITLSAQIDSRYIQRTTMNARFHWIDYDGMDFSTISELRKKGSASLSHTQYASTVMLPDKAKGLRTIEWLFSDRDALVIRDPKLDIGTDVKTWSAAIEFNEQYGFNLLDAKMSQDQLHGHTYSMPVLRDAHIVIPARNHDYTYRKIYDYIVPDVEYTLSISEVECTEGSAKSIDIVLFNFFTNQVVQRQSFDVRKGKQEWTFKTPPGLSLCKLIAYSGPRAKSANNEVHLRGLALYREASLKSHLMNDQTANMQYKGIQLIVDNQDDESNKPLTLYSGLVPGASYLLKLDEITVSQGQAKHIDAALYDCENKKVYSSYCFFVDQKESSWYISLPTNASKLTSVILYAGSRGATQGNSISVGSASLELLDYPVPSSVIEMKHSYMELALNSFRYRQVGFSQE